MRNKFISFILAIGALTALSFGVRQAFAYDSSAAVDYAEQWWNGRNSNYYDYGDYDCANFVSQCLIAGGLDLSIHPGADSYGSIPSCRDLHDYLVDSLGATWGTRPKGQVEPLWFLPGDPAIFGYSDAHPRTHAVFAVTGDATHYATCNAHSDNAHQVSISQFYTANPSFDRCTYYHIPTQTIPAPPSLLSPDSETEPGPEINTLTPQLNWQESVGADYYTLAISVYPYGTANIVYNPQQVYGSSHTVSSGVLENGNKYRWNMQAHNSTVWSDVSNTLYFQTPSLIQEAGSLSMEIKRLKTLIFPRDSMLYVEPNTSELANFRALAISFLNSDWESALMQASALGYELVDYYDTDTSRHYYLLREELNEFEQQNLGWGSYIWNPYDQAEVMVEVPHPLYDIKTPEFAIEVFQGICGRALLMAGAHRAAMGDGIYGIANVAGQEDCIFQIVHKTWSEQTTLPIQIHGFDLDKHIDFPIGTDVVLSNGDGAIPRAQIDLDQAFGVAGLLSYVYNTLPVDDPINILVNGDIPGSTFSSLSAGDNVQGQYTRNTYNAPWIHCELEQSIRFNDPSRWQPAVTAIVDTLSISRVKGIDVSSYQGDIDWSQVYNSGYRFAFARASWGDEKPPTYVDAKFQQNMENGYTSGMLMGAYHFAYPDYGTDAASEARHFLNVAGTYITNGYLRPVLDLERGESLGWTALSNWIREWMDTVNHETGVEPILYTYTDYARNLDTSLNQYDLWIAHWTYDPNTPPNTGIWDSWDFWQYSDNGSVPGITGSVDLDLFNGDMPRLETFLIVAGPNDNPPVVDDFSVAPDSVTLGNSFTISYIVSDDIGLNRVELWRAVDVNGDGEPDWPDDPEGYIDIHYLSGQTSYSDSFSDTPSVVDTYWYGLHVVDNAEQLSFEPDPPGPIERTVTTDTTPPSPDPMTWLTEPHQTSTSSISMVATTAHDESTPISYYFEFYSSPTGGSGGNDSAWQTSTTYSDSDLQVNHQYAYRVKARDSVGNETTYSSTSYEYTEAKVPGTASFSVVTDSSIQVNWTTNGNPSWTEYFCENITNGTNSGWTTSTQWDDTDLISETQYCYQVKARNGDGEETGRTNLGCETTLASKIPLMDLNNDGMMNLGDFAIFGFYWMNDTCCDPNWCEGSDSDQSGMVNFLDLSNFVDDWLWQYWTVIQLTDNSEFDLEHDVSGSSIVWMGGGISEDYEIFLYDGTKTTQVTNNGYDDVFPGVSGTNIAWLGQVDADGEIFLFDGTTTTRLTDNSYQERVPRVSGSHVIWEGYDGNDDEIFLYDGTSLTQLTDNSYADEVPRVSGSNVVWRGSCDPTLRGEIFLYDGTSTTQLTNDTNFDLDPDVSGSNVVWASTDIMSQYEIFLYDGTDIIQLTNNTYRDFDPHVSGSNVVWKALIGGDWEIFFYDGTTTIQLTDNSSDDEHPRVSGSIVVWHGWDGNDKEIFVYDGTCTIQLTDNNYDDEEPEVSGSTIVWRGWDGNDCEIFMAIPTDTIF